MALQVWRQTTCLCPLDFTWQAQVVTCVQARSAHKLCCISSVIRGVFRPTWVQKNKSLAGRNAESPSPDPEGALQLPAPCMHSSPVFVFSWSCSLFFSCILLKNYSSYLILFWGVWGRGRQTLNRRWIYSDTRAISDKIMESKSFSCTCPKVGIQMSRLCCLKEHFLPLVCAGFFKKIIFVAAYKPCLK